MENQNTETTETTSPESGEVSFKSWQCILCGFIYNEEDGIPEDGVAPGTRWEDVPDSWCCPDCSASKIDFEMVEV